MASQTTIRPSKKSRWTEWKCITPINHPLVSATNLGQELGWTTEAYKSLGVEYRFLRSRGEKNRCPHPIHSLDDLISFGGLIPPTYVHADARKTRHPEKEQGRSF